MDTPVNSQLPSYRCRIRQHSRPCADDAALDPAVTVKAINATEAMRLAGLTTGCAVIDAERQDAMIGGAA
jgi:hypothetical protein